MSKDFQLRVQYDPITNNLMFDGTILQYDQSRETKNTCEEIAVLLNCTQNSNELESDHIFSKQGREAFGMHRNKTVCMLRDRDLHRDKTNYSVDLYCIIVLQMGLCLGGKCTITIQ